MDPETKRAWRRLQKEVRENTPIVLRGLASSGKHMPRKLYSAVVRGFKSLTSRAKEWELPFGEDVQDLTPDIARRSDDRDPIAHSHHLHL